MSCDQFICSNVTARLLISFGMSSNFMECCNCYFLWARCLFLMKAMDETFDKDAHVLTASTEITVKFDTRGIP